jgi:serine/threonine-protein kinase
MAMEYVEGHDLGEYFRRGIVFGPSDIVSIATQLLDALDHAHEQGVVHRDIKPANIILTTAGRVKVTDFGIAHIYTSELTQAGMVMGTPSYMAPEQFQGIPVDGRADLFSVGVLLFHLLTGRKPFEGTYDQMAYQVCHTQAPPPSLIAPDRAPPFFDAIVARALAKSPEERYATARAFRDELMSAFSAPVTPAISEETRITGGKAAVGGAEKSRNKPATGSSSVIPPAGWDATLLRQVELQLARFVGPLARLMVRRAATATTDPGSLYSRLAAELDNSAEREAFLQAVSHGGTHSGNGTAAPPARDGAPPGTAEAAPPDPREAITDEIIDRAVRELTPHLGPIARILAKRAAAQCSGPRAFYRELAAQLTDDHARKQFLRSGGFEE